MPYIIGERINQHALHHKSIKALWETKWKKPCSLGIYPFVDGKLEDFESVFSRLIESNVRPPYDFEAYAAPFFPVAEKLENEAYAAQKVNNLAQASELYLRAAALYRISRFPLPRSPKQKEAWTRNKAAYVKGAELLEGSFSEVHIPHTHAAEGEGSSIPVYVRFPSHASASSPVPCIIQIFGLDGYRTEMTHASTMNLRRGWATVAVEIPGTGDCPALKHDPHSPDRLWTSLLDWLDGCKALDSKKTVAWGLSTGGYYAMRIAHTHKDRLLGVVSQGGGCHRMFDKEWIDNVDHLEYPFDLAECLATKFGYDNVETMKMNAQKTFSLLENGIFDQPSTQLLLINGMDDEIFPIEDSMLALQHGNAKSARFVPNAMHMGDPVAEGIILQWIEGLFSEASPPK